LKKNSNAYERLALVVAAVVGPRFALTFRGGGIMKSITQLLCSALLLATTSLYADSPDRSPQKWEPENKDCTVNTNSRNYEQDPAFLAGFRVGDNEASHYRPFARLICPGGPAEGAGMQEGDIFVSISIHMKGPSDTPVFIKSAGTGDVVTSWLYGSYSVSYTVQRGNALVTLDPIFPRQTKPKGT
jgi:hypothetical protein